MDKTEIANNVVTKLFATERSVDDAMVNAAQLLEAMVSARRQLNLGGPVGEVAQARVAEAISALSESRRAVMAAHAALEDVSKKTGIQTTMDTQQKGDTQLPTQTGIRLAR